MGATTGGSKTVGGRAAARALSTARKAPYTQKAWKARSASLKAAGALMGQYAAQKFGRR